MASAVPYLPLLRNHLRVNFYPSAPSARPSGGSGGCSPPAAPPLLYYHAFLFASFRPSVRPSFCDKEMEEPSAPARVRREPASDVNAGTCLTNCIDHHHIDTVFIYKGNKGAEEPSALRESAASLRAA